jgi:hypothetical protein
VTWAIARSLERSIAAASASRQRVRYCIGGWPSRSEKRSERSHRRRDHQRRERMHDRIKQGAATLSF